MSDRDVPIFSVGQLNHAVRLHIENTFGTLYVEGEVTSLHRHSSGHVYFKLGDPQGTAQIDCVMWRSVVARFGRVLEVGAHVVCLGTVSLYEQRGQFQFIAKSARESGRGAKARALAALRERLRAEGLFAEERKRPLPASPRRVGVVTSRTGAALQDICKVIGRRMPVTIVVSHASVQGEAAPGEIVAALRRLVDKGNPDVVIVGRGGGASEDLDAFNEEQVVREVARCPVPVICAVGHEIDVSLAELAADRRAATPSEAAELAVPDKEHLVRRFADAAETLASAARGAVHRRRRRVDAAAVRLGRRDPRVALRERGKRLAAADAALSAWAQRAVMRWRYRLAAGHAALRDRGRHLVPPRRQRLQQHRAALRAWPDRAIARKKADLVTASGRLYAWPKGALTAAKGRLAAVAAALDGLSPLAVLQRGYAIVSSDGAVVRDAADVSPGAELDIRLAKGSVAAVATQVRRQQEEEGDEGQ